MQGEVRFAGEPAPDVSARAQWRSKVACVYQKSTIIPELTVGENLFLNDHPGSRFGTIHWRELRRLGRAGARVWGLDVDVDQRAGELTVGQKQLLEIARALRQGSRFIILDEPTARLESREIKQLFDHITALKRAGVTFLFISHHLQEIYEICERVAVMRDGRLVAEAAVGDLDQDAARRGHGRRVLCLEPSETGHDAASEQNGAGAIERRLAPDRSRRRLRFGCRIGSRRLAQRPRRRARRSRRPRRIGQVRARRRRSSDS